MKDKDSELINNADIQYLIINIHGNSSILRLQPYYQLSEIRDYWTSKTIVPFLSLYHRRL